MPSSEKFAWLLLWRERPSFHQLHSFTFGLKDRPLEKGVLQPFLSKLCSWRKVTGRLAVRCQVGPYNPCDYALHLAQFVGGMIGCAGE
jgi:hypothetical protein